MAPHVSNSAFTNYYDVLHLPRDATRAQIRLRFKKLSLLFHPDKNKDDDAPRIFRSLKTAEEILSDATKKAQFDTQLTDVDNFLKGGSARAAAASSARATAHRDAEKRARDQRHYERDKARAQQYNRWNAPNMRPNWNPKPEWETNKPPEPKKPQRPREDIFMPAQYRPSGRQPPWSIFGRGIPRNEEFMPWGKNPIPIGSKNPFHTNPLTGEELPVHNNFPLNPGDHCSAKIDAAWPTVHNEGYRVLRGCSDLYRHQWKDAVAEAAHLDTQALPLVEEGLRRIEYMFHKFAEYVWGLLSELPRNMAVLIDPDAAFDRLESVMFTLQEFCNRGQHLPMEIGFMSQNLRNLGAADPKDLLAYRASHDLVVRQVAHVYEAFMGELRAPEPEEEEL